MGRTVHDADNDTRIRRIVDAGTALYGERWQRRLASEIGVSPQLITYLVSGERALTPAVERKVVSALGREIDRLAEAIAKLKLIRRGILSDLAEELVEMKRQLKSI
jgi:plasmid maintenance system antidote protein VapI